MSDKAPEDPSTPPPPPSAAVAAAALLSGGKAAKGPLSGLKAPTNTPLGSGANTPLAEKGSLTPNQKLRKSAESGAARVSSPLVKRPDEKDMMKQVQAKLGAIALDEASGGDDEDDADDDEEVDQEFGGDDSSEDEEDNDEDLEAAHAAMMESLSPYTRACLEKMTELNEKADSHFSEYELERKALERKYLNKYQDVYDERRTLITEGVDKATIEDDDKKANDDAEDEAERKGVPSFWLTAMSNHMVLASRLTEEDIEALNSLTDIRVLDVPEEDKFGYRLEFEFGPNRFFSNEVLTKTYYIANFYHQGSYPVLDNAEASTIEWKSQAVNLTEKLITKTTGGKAGRPERRRVVKQEEESFFNFFSTPWQDKEHGGRGDDMEDEEKYVLASEDFECAEVFRRKLVPKALGWFLGEEEDDEFEDEEGDSDEDDDEYGDEESEEDSDEDSEDDSEDESDGEGGDAMPRKAKGKKGGKKGKGPQYKVEDGQEGGQPECKQQ